MRLDKYLSKNGYGTRKEVEKIIKSGRVIVNNEVIKDKSLFIKDIDVFVDGNKVEHKEFIYLMMNKPKGYISATKDKKHKTVLDLIDKYSNYDLQLIGRLDKNTTGIIIITNDGVLNYELTSPKKDKEKTYLVTHKKELSLDSIEKLKNGIELKDFTTKPAKFEVVSTFCSLLTITEGKYHQVKRMFDAIGNQVVDLDRISFAGVQLDKNLKQGEYRELTAEEIILLKNS